MKKSNGTNRKMRTAASFLLLLCFALSACAYGPISASTGQKVALWFVIVIGALAVLALVLFMLIFPLINRLAKTHLPALDIFAPCDDEAAAKARAAAKAEKRKTREREKREAATRTRASGSRTAAKKEKPRTTERNEKPRRNAGYTDDRYVKTVRIDTLYNPQQEQELTASKIDKAMRTAVADSNKKQADKKSSK